MKYSKLITTCSNGFYIDQHLLKPIGISENSHCWGVFVEPKKPNNHSNDLIISGLPFRSWACMIRMQIRIKNEDFEGNLKKLYEILYQNNMNIFYMQIIYSGYTHYLLDLILELTEFRDKVIKIREEANKKTYEINKYFSSPRFVKITINPDDFL